MPSVHKVKDFLYEKESYKIRGACFQVWKAFGNAFKEKIVDKALSKALEKQGLKVEEQKRIDIFFENEKIGTYVPDKVINDSILLELKAKTFLTKQDVDQFWKYLKGSNYKLGFLVNFGSTKLTIKRIVYDTVRQKRSALTQR
ncbi:MAG: GxxExxY protein [Candidatus Nealsonbacteria bacterium CG08_land_8_20_14_0_20_43_11]|uniref:GxxExxY protein n=1 Tax=Candidatus Nealsonbacteria bacterium CG08_land_8_20_14_0_20_43_11 TaxID=1974706 RepID=A0A2M6T112_9BACT|nr:MAG: GxxExxY protein [Candidatus Nealsonbacteria bacterium CG08_land_8_20_14_0_20_43_11]